MNLEILTVLVFKSCKLFVKTLVACYFVGMIWYILVKLNHEIYIGNDVDKEDTQLTSFMFEYDWVWVQPNRGDHIIAVMYYAFTTMSTVGFGDFHPVNDFERILCLMILIFGNATFTIVIGGIIEMI